MMTVDTPSTDVFTVARSLAPDTEHAALPAGVDPQLVVVRARTAPPYFLLHADDAVLAQLAGHGELELRHSNVLRLRLEPGDLVYLPAGTGYRYLPAAESVQVRYQAPGAEAVAWFCPVCGDELWRHEFDPARTPTGRADGLAAYVPRDCPACGARNFPGNR